MRWLFVCWFVVFFVFVWGVFVCLVGRLVGWLSLSRCPRFVCKGVGTGGKSLCLRLRSEIYSVLGRDHCLLDCLFVA